MQTNTLPPTPNVGVLIDQVKVGSDYLPDFMAGDIVLFSGVGDLYGRVGGWLMQTSGEGATFAVHTAQFLDTSRYLEMDMVAKIRATHDILKKHQVHDLWERRGFEVWRCRWLSAEEREAVTRQALYYLGAKFGMAKFLTHLLDGLINKVLGKEVFFFRRLNHDKRYPICSWITAFSYDTALHYRFGVPPECADPDAIDDWVNTHPGEWERIFRLDKYS